MTDQTASAPAEASRARTVLGREVRSFAELFSVSGIAFAFPVLNFLSNNSSVFFTFKAKFLDLFVIALLAVVLIPFIAWAGEVWIGLLLPRSRRFVHAFVIGLGVGLYVLQFAKHMLSPSPATLLVTAIIAGAAGALLRIKSQIFVSFISTLAFAPALLAIWFVFFSPANRVVIQPSFDGTKVTIKSPHRIVMLAFDELPIGSLLDSSGNVDEELFPNFAALQKSSTFYRNMSTVAPITHWAIPALLTGQYPEESLLPASGDHPESIFRLLNNTYRMNSRDQITSLCPDKYCAQLGKQRSHLESVQAISEGGLDLWRSAVSLRAPIATSAPPEETSKPFDEARGFINSIRRDNRPVFDYAHIMLPHSPWVYLSTFQTHRPGDNQNFENASFAKWRTLHNAQLGRAIHLLQLQATDTFLGQVVARLKKIGAWDDTILVVTADHGVSFTTGEPQRVVTRKNAHEILFPPLFIKGPAQNEPIVNDGPMRTIDVFPTVVEIIGAKIPWKIDGKPASATRHPNEPLRVYQFKNPIWETPLVSAGKGYLTFPRSINKAALSMTASNYAGDPALRIFRVGEYGNLLSQPTSSLTITPPFADRAIYVPGLGANPLNYFNPNSPNLDQTWLEGYSSGLRKESTIAFAVNGRIAGFGFSSRFPKEKHGYYFAQLAPSLINAGNNSLEAFELTGPASAPLLTPIRIG